VGDEPVVIGRDGLELDDTVTQVATENIAESTTTDYSSISDGTDGSLLTTSTASANDSVEMNGTRINGVEQQENRSHVTDTAGESRSWTPWAAISK